MDERLRTYRRDRRPVSGWVLISGCFGAAAFVKNITNKVYRVGAISIFNEAGYTSGLYGDPRTYGFDVSYRF